MATIPRWGPAPASPATTAPGRTPTAMARARATPTPPRPAAPPASPPRPPPPAPPPPPPPPRPGRRHRPRQAVGGQVGVREAGEHGDAEDARGPRRLDRPAQHLGPPGDVHR